MRNGSSTDPSERGSISICLIFLTIVLLAYSLPAQCNGWDVSGMWKAKLSNGLILTMKLQQNGKQITGSSFYSGTFEGVVDNGSVDGDKFGVYFNWPNPKNNEVFGGKILPSGIIEGTALTASEPGKQIIWTSDRPMKCLSKAIGSLKIKPPDVPPFISAKATGDSKYTISWDGGKDHPYAEIWLKVNDGEEKFLVERGKGTHELTLQSSATYTFILTDSGKTLGRVTVKGY